MTVEVLSFLVGSVLVGVAIIGGGFELKELKIPRVGVAARLVSLGAGGCFILLALALIGLRHPELLQGQGGSQSAPAVAQSFTDTTATAPQSAENAFSLPAQGEVENASASADGEAFGGFDEDTPLAWNQQGVEYRATLYTQGQTGVARVEWTNAQGAVETIDEDLSLEQDGQGIRYHGANVRYAGTNTTHPDYLPDLFTIVSVGAGQWSYSEVCDEAMTCWPLSGR